ncbi:MAG: ethanolamine utilization microcompartment protein EutL [Clostridiales bacterium]|nr:ethanolamine utilization microcompartment protein EutL [Clostridiales bacterium]
MRGDALRAKVLALRIIPQADPGLCQKLGIPAAAASLGLITCDSDDVGYTALDEATKKANVSVAYAQSMYAGAANANTALAGEFFGILSGPTPEEVKSGLEAAEEFIRDGACFISANHDDSVVYYAHCISRTGSYLSTANGLPQGVPIAYLIAPPLEAVAALDAALKAANVTVAAFYGPPSYTNFGGALLTGSQSDCMAACQAFADAVEEIAQHPLEWKG